MSVLRGRPPGDALGISGSSRAHSASPLRSDIRRHLADISDGVPPSTSLVAIAVSPGAMKHKTRCRATRFWVRLTVWLSLKKRMKACPKSLHGLIVGSRGRLSNRQRSPAFVAGTGLHAPFRSLPDAGVGRPTTEAASDMVAEGLRARISYLEPQFRGSWPFVSVASPTPMTRIMHILSPPCCRRPRRPVAAGHSGVGAYTSAPPSLSIQVIFGFGLSSQQSILDHVKQQFLNGLL